jgi:protocatechuate 3,4-dioxygenase beta subunit
MLLDDVPIGKVHTRREALVFLGATGALLFFGCSSSSASTDPTGVSSSCVVRPELTEGPYYVDEELNRSDIRTDPSDGTVKAGALLALTFSVSSATSGSCSPLAGAIVDVWHCDALGVYSDVSDPGFNTLGKKFLRGYQVTDANGVARFTTIYPGWYQGRAVHFHFKVRSAAGASSAYEFTSQLFFDDSLTDQVHAQQPYAAKGQRTLRNSGDGIYNQGGSQLVLNVTQASDGYAGTFDIALNNGN